MSDPELNESRRRLHGARAELAYHLELFGDHLAEKNKWQGLTGEEAVRYYLMQKHSWLPRDVAALSFEEMRFALHVEMQDWRAPAAAKPRKGK